MTNIDIKTIYSSFIEKYVNIYDVRKSKLGRKNIRNISFYINKIICVLFTGISWKELDLFKNIGDPTSEAIRKKHNKWLKLGIYDKVHKEIEDCYLDEFKNTITDLFIDSTIMPNLNGTKNMTGFCQKIKSKRSMKANIICDNNKIPYKAIISSSQPHDSTFIEPLVDLLPENLMNTTTYNKSLTISADSGYIIKSERNLKLRKEKHVSINAVYRKNMKNKKNNKNKKSLKKRHLVENVNAILKRTYKRNSFIKDRKINTINTWYTMTCTMMILKFMKESEIKNKKKYIKCV